MQPAYDHKAGRSAEVTKVSPLPRCVARINALTEIAALAAGVPTESQHGGTYSVDEPFKGRVEISIHAGELRFVRGRNINPNASKLEKEMVRREMIDELFTDMIKVAAGQLTKPKPPEEWKTLPLGQRVLGFFEMLFVAFAFLFDWRPKGKRGAK